MNWTPENEKPKPYVTVLLALICNDFTTGYWADIDDGGCWMGFALNQPCPMYRLEEGSVTHWAEIVPPEGE
jgi:hypothetical protein